ncbi:MAG: hypothetical protein WA615_08900, partial [Bradyrhizobium sp.]
MPPPVIKARLRPTATALSCELPVACALGKNKPKQDRCNTVIEKAFTLDQKAEAALDAGVLEHGKNGNRIGCSNQ